MADNTVAAFSPRFISSDYFLMLITESGGVPMDNPRRSEGRVSADTRHVWLFLSNDMTEDNIPLTLERVSLALGAAPQSKIVLAMSKEPGSQQLAIKTVCDIARHIPLVLIEDQPNGKIFFPTDLEALRKSGKALFDF